MFTWFNQSSSNLLGSIVQNTDGLAFAAITQNKQQKPVLTNCIFQPQLSDLQTTLGQLLQKLGKVKLPLTTLLDSQYFLLLLMQRPAVKKEELADAVRWQIKDQLKYPAEEAIIEILEIPGQQQRGRLPMIYVIAAHKDNILSAVKFIEDAQLDLQYVDVPELAQRNIASLLTEDLSGVALLNIQPSQSLLTITHKGELYLSRIIDIGVDDLEAQQQDKTDNNELSLETLPTENDDQLGKMILEIQRSLDYYESHYGKAAINNLVLAPLDSRRATELKQILQQDLGISVHQLDLNTLLHSETTIDQDTQTQCFYAIGAALRLAVDHAADEQPDHNTN